MSAPTGANSEYSRGSGAFGPGPERRWQGHSGVPRFVGKEVRPEGGEGAPDVGEGRGAAIAAVFLAALLGAALIVISQFTALYHLQSAAGSAPIKTAGTGSNHAWAPIPIALLAAVLALTVYRKRSRAALVALAVLGIVTLLIALIVDLPDAHATGLVGSGASRYAEATSTPSAGLYMETLGAVVLLAAGGIGFLMLIGSREKWSAS